MAGLTAEKFAQRAFDCDLLDAHQLESIWSEFGSRNVDLNDFTALLVRKGLLTNFQVDRLLAGKRDGYFYGKYKVLYMIGAGTFARVYRAVDRETGRVVAVKVLRLRYMDDFETREQFLREARMVMPLRHPNIVPIYEVAEERGRPFMVMEFVEGQNLRDFVKVRSKLDLERSLDIMIDVGAALDYAAGRGVTHRDLKLSNVLLSSLGRAKLVDFGLAAVAADMSDQAIVDAPNPRSIDYAGLERATGVRKGDSRSDIFFCGCMLYHMLSGKPPLFETRDRIQRLSVQRYREIPPLRDVAPDTPNYIVAIVAKAMDLRPDKRYQTPGELLKDLKKARERVRRGETGTEEADLAAEKEADAQAANRRLEQEGQDLRVMIVEPKTELQDLFRDRLKRRGYRVLITANPHMALQRFQDHLEDEPLAHCVVFNSQHLGMAAVEAFNRFGEDEETREVPAILLVDPQHRSLIQAAKTSDHRILLGLPVSVKKLRAALFKLLRASGAAVS